MPACRRNAEGASAAVPRASEKTYATVAACKTVKTLGMTKRVLLAAMPSRSMK